MHEACLRTVGATDRPGVELAELEVQWATHPGARTDVHGFVGTTRPDRVATDWKSTMVRI
jgi:hypothetical protein